MAHVQSALGVHNDKFQVKAPIRKFAGIKGTVKTTNLTGKLISKLSLAGKTTLSGIVFVADKVKLMARTLFDGVKKAAGAVGRALSGPASAVVTSLKTAGKSVSTSLKKAALDCNDFFVAIPGVVKENIDNLKNHMKKQAQARQEAKAAKPHRQGGLFRKKVIMKNDNTKAHRQLATGSVREASATKMQNPKSKTDAQIADELSSMTISEDIKAMDRREETNRQQILNRAKVLHQIGQGGVTLKPAFCPHSSMDSVEVATKYHDDRQRYLMEDLFRIEAEDRTNKANFAKVMGEVRARGNDDVEEMEIFDIPVLDQQAVAGSTPEMMQVEDFDDALHIISGSEDFESMEEMDSLDSLSSDVGSMGQMFETMATDK